MARQRTTAPIWIGRVARGAQRRGGGGAAEAAHGARGVEVAVVGGLHRGADAGRDFVADDDGVEQFAPAGVGLFGQGQRGGDRRAAGVIDRVAVDVVELHCVRHAAVDPGGGGRKGGGGATGQAGAAGAQFRPVSAQELQAGLSASARVQRRQPIQEGALGVVDDLFRQPGLRIAGAIGGNRVQQHACLHRLLRRVSAPFASADHSRLPGPRSIDKKEKERSCSRGAELEKVALPIFHTGGAARYVSCMQQQHTHAMQRRK